jgi:ribonuclease HI
MPSTFVIHTDGGARGNPGPAGIGYVIQCDDKVIKTGKAYIGETTNNQAEYEALIRALTELDTIVPKEGRAGVRVEVRMDSELVVKQLRKEYKVKDVGLKLQFAKAGALIARFPNIAFIHVMREENSAADELANQAMDGYQNK